MLKPGKRPAEDRRVPPPDRVADPAPFPEDLQEENRLRPLRLDEFVGQPALKEQVRISIEAAPPRAEALDHVLLHRPPGLAKTTPAAIPSPGLGVEITHTAAPGLTRAGDP